jgi:hypothetical protein
LVKHKISTNDKLEIQLDFPIKNIIALVGWMYQPSNPIVFDTEYMCEQISFFEIFDLLEIEDAYSDTMHNYFLFVKKLLARHLPKYWKGCLSILERHHDQHGYNQLLIKEVLQLAQVEIKDYVISYLLDIIHSEYLQDDRHKMNRFKNFNNEDDFPISLELTHEIIVWALVDHNQKKSSDSSRKNNSK